MRSAGILLFFGLLPPVVSHTHDNSSAVGHAIPSLHHHHHNYDHRAQLVCHAGTRDKMKCTRCMGACIVKLYYQHGQIQLEEAGCQPVLNSTKEKEGNTRNKCTKELGEKPLFMRYNVVNKLSLKRGSTELVGNFTVFKKCCFTTKCNQPEIFKSVVKHITHDVGHVETNRRDGFAIGIILEVLIACLLGYSIWMTYCLYRMEKHESPDYRQTLDEKLLCAGKCSSESMEYGKDVRGELTIKETANILATMLFPPKIESQGTSTSDTRVAFLPPKVIQAAGTAHSLVRALRDRPHYMQSILFRMIEHGPYFFPFKPMELMELFSEASEVFQLEKSLITVGSCCIIGDLRGGYSDLCRWLQAVGWPPKTRLLFLGNILDNEQPGSLEAISLIAALKIAFPSEVYVLRGQTETFPFVPTGRFPEERTDNALGRCIMRMCSFLPTAAIVQERILTVPSGITPLVEVQKDLAEQPRPTMFETLTDVQRHLIFNQPSTLVRMYRPNSKSRGDFFGYSAVERICADLQVNMVVRGGAPVPEGYCPCWNHSLVSLWSTTSHGSDKAAVLLVSPFLEVTPLKMLRQTDPIPTLSSLDTERVSTNRIV